MSNKALIRITKNADREKQELKALQHASDLSMRVEYQDDDVFNSRFLVMGPPRTPYEFGFFEFYVKFPTVYPDKPPVIISLTTDQGQTRFNPNIYASGYVCLSILGTWRSHTDMQWSAAQGLESVMLSIQSLLSENPWTNEPGFEYDGDVSARPEMEEYALKILHETIRISVVERLESYLGIGEDATASTLSGRHKLDVAERKSRLKPFENYCKTRFLWYFDKYMYKTSVTSVHYKNGEQFVLAPFESPTNGMCGSYDFPGLRKRLIRIKKELEKESSVWVEEGRLLLKRKHETATIMKNAYQDAVRQCNIAKKLTVDLNLVKGNPFEWRITFYGQPYSQLDGAKLHIRMIFSSTFPLESPRVVVETGLFHYRIKKDGVLCYSPRNASDVKGHLEAIFESLQDRDPAYDPRVTFNFEAAQMLWGSEDGKKEYHLRLRKSIHEHAETY